MIIVLILVGLVLWYFIYGLTCALNGATIGRNQYSMPFQCLWEEFLWLVIPGRKGAYIRNEVIGLKYMKEDEVPSGVIMGSGEQSWYYRDVIKGELYKSCAKDVLPGWKFFLVMHVLIPFGPVVCYFLFLE